MLQQPIFENTCPICGEELLPPRLLKSGWRPAVHKSTKEIHCAQEVYDKIDNAQDVGFREEPTPTYGDMLADGFDAVDPDVW